MNKLILSLLAVAFFVGVLVLNAQDPVVYQYYQIDRDVPCSKSECSSGLVVLYRVKRLDGAGFDFVIRVPSKMTDPQRIKDFIRDKAPQVEAAMNIQTTQ